MTGLAGNNLDEELTTEIDKPRVNENHKQMMEWKIRQTTRPDSTPPPRLKPGRGAR